ncbi:MAG: pyridoxamine 5'-phosphate oxidase family protein [Hyphomicrobiales bacterium]|nr:pyridoxamine 5'-phosphate oxidase family protein [Hyphomicrobiales bacterium]
MDAYAARKLNKVRVGNRAAYDKETVNAVLDEGLVAHVGFVDRDRPIVIPMIYGRVDDTLYLHGAKATRFVKALGKGVPVCVTVTLIDGIVVGRSAFHSSMNYRSVVAHGQARLLTDEDERIRAMTVLTDHMLPGRWDEARPASEKELKATGIIAAAIEAASAKARTGDPIDEDDDYALPVWGGVVPVHTIFGVPQDDCRLAAGTVVPASVAQLLKRNGD